MRRLRDLLQVKEPSIGPRSVDSMGFLASVGAEASDPSRLDIEGREYQPLEDARFAAVPVSRLVVESHKTADHSESQLPAPESLA